MSAKRGHAYQADDLHKTEMILALLVVGADMVAKPTVVIVPRAWYTPASYADLTALLQRADYPVRCKKLPSTDADMPSTQTVATDAAFLREQLLLPLIQDGADILLILHSYGGCPGSAAAKGLSKQECSSSGLHGGIVRLAYIAAFLAKEGVSLFSCLGGR